MSSQECELSSHCKVLVIRFVFFLVVVVSMKMYYFIRIYDMSRDARKAVFGVSEQV